MVPPPGNWHADVVLRLEAVLEVLNPNGFVLWPTATLQKFDYQRLHGSMSLLEVGTAMHSFVTYNNVDVDAEEAPPEDPLGAFLFGVLHVDTALAAGGLRLIDTDSDAVVVPGCCNDLEDWRDWFGVLDGETAWGGHDPSPAAVLEGDVVRVTADVEADDSAVILVPAELLRPMLEGVETDLRGFLVLAKSWAERHVPEHAPRLLSALASALSMPAELLAP